MTSSLPFYRQFTGRFFLLLLCFLCSSFIGLALYFYQVQQIVALDTQKFPEIVKQNKRQVTLIHTERLIHDIIASNKASNFTQYYQQIVDNLKRLSTLSIKEKPLFERRLQQLQLQTENIQDLANDARRNTQLNESVIIQLTLVADSLVALISAQTKKKDKLYQNITSARVTSYEIRTYAKELSNVVIKLNSNQALHRLVIDNLVMFSAIDLQYDLIEFNYIQQQTSSSFQHWLLNASASSNKAELERSLEEKMIVLNQLLFTEQNIFAKWHEQLRKIDIVRIELQSMLSELDTLLTKNLTIAPLAIAVLEQESQLKRWLLNQGINLTGYFSWIVTGVFSSLFLLFLSILINIRIKPRVLNEQSVIEVSELVEKNEVLSQSATKETSTISESISQPSYSQYNETDYFNLQQQQEKYLLMMSQHSGYVFWQLPCLSLLQKQMLSSILDLDCKGSYWRHLFSRGDVRVIISAAREAKSKQTIQHLLLTMKCNKPILLTLEYYQGTWQGSVFSLANSVKALDEDLTPLRLSKSWRQDIVTNELDVQAMVNLLSPWLEFISHAGEKPALALVTSRVDKGDSSNELTTITENNNVVDNNSSSEVNVDATVDSSLDSMPIEVDDNINTEANNELLIDFVQFAQNQGSVELAALMLDDYLMNIEHELLNLANELAKKDLLMAQNSLQRLMHNTIVIAAKPLLTNCHILEEMLTDANDTSVVLSLEQEQQQQDNLNNALEQLKLSITQLAEFVELI